MKESELKRVYNYSVYPKDPKITTNKGFVNIDNGCQGGTHWTGSYIKVKKSFYFDSFGGPPEKFQPQQLPKPINFQSKNSRNKK